VGLLCYLSAFVPYGGGVFAWLLRGFSFPVTLQHDGRFSLQPCVSVIALPRASLFRYNLFIGYVVESSLPSAAPLVYSGRDIQSPQCVSYLLENHAPLIGDEKVFEVRMLLRSSRSVESLRLDRDVELRDGLVADDLLGLDGERSGRYVSSCGAAGECLRERRIWVGLPFQPSRSDVTYPGPRGALLFSFAISG